MHKVCMHDYIRTSAKPFAHGCMQVHRHAHTHTPRPCFMFVRILKIHLVSSERKSSSIRRLISIMQDAGRDAMYLICFCLILSDGMCHIHPEQLPKLHRHTYTSTQSVLPTVPSLPLLFSFLICLTNTILLPHSHSPLSLSAILPSLLTS